MELQDRLQEDILLVVAVEVFNNQQLQDQVVQEVVVQVNQVLMNVQLE
tara:strand:- start:133 stop:276 length:144 start_codon:yes stop_codon:yes gene_type:complete